MDSGVIVSDFIAGALVGIVIGFFLGFLTTRYLRERKNGGKTLTELQLASMAMFFAYIGISSILREPISEFIAIAILSLTGGEALGAVVEKWGSKK